MGQNLRFLPLRWVNLRTTRVGFLAVLQHLPRYDWNNLARLLPLLTLPVYAGVHPTRLCVLPPLPLPNRCICHQILPDPCWCRLPACAFRCLPRTRGRFVGYLTVTRFPVRYSFAPLLPVTTTEHHPPPPALPVVVGCYSGADPVGSVDCYGWITPFCPLLLLECDIYHGYCCAVNFLYRLDQLVRLVVLQLYCALPAAVRFKLKRRYLRLDLPRAEGFCRLYVSATCRFAATTTAHPAHLPSYLHTTPPCPTVLTLAMPLPAVYVAPLLFAIVLPFPHTFTLNSSPYLP